MEIPDDITKKYGSTGESIFKRGHKGGKLEGAKIAKSPFATEVNNLTNSILKAKTKENYKAPSANDVGKICSNTFKFDGNEPDRNALKRIVITALKAMEGMELPPKKVKSEKPPTPQTN